MTVRTLAILALLAFSACDFTKENRGATIPGSADELRGELSRYISGTDYLIVGHSGGDESVRRAGVFNDWIILIDYKKSWTYVMFKDILARDSQSLVYKINDIPESAKVVRDLMTHHEEHSWKSIGDGPHYSLINEANGRGRVNLTLRGMHLIDKEGLDWEMKHALEALSQSAKIPPFHLRVIIANKADELSVSELRKLKYINSWKGELIMLDRVPYKEQ